MQVKKLTEKNIKETSNDDKYKAVIIRISG